MKRTIHISTAGLLAVLTAVLLLTVGALKSPQVGALSVGSTPLLLASALVVAGLALTIHMRAGRRSGKIAGIERFLPASLWGLLPLGALLGLLLGGLAPALVSEGSPIETALGTAIYPDELLGLIFGIVVGVLFALLVDARLAGGLLFGYGVGLPTGLLVSAPLTHNLYWSYGGYLAIFGVLGLLHIYLKPLLDSIRQKG